MKIESLTPQDVSDMTDSLELMLGQSNFGLLHLAVGASSTFEIIKWMHGEACPDDEQLERLAFVYEVMLAVQDCRDDSYARHWFRDYRCPDGATVYDSVRVCNFDQVRDSVNELGTNLTA